MSQILLPNNWQPRAYQRSAWAYLENGGRHAELIWHRRSGKDEVALHWTACAAHERIGNYWYLLPQASQARKAIWDAINPHTGKRRIDEVFPHELRSFTRNNEMIIGLKCGSSCQVLGSDNYNSLVGSPPVGVVFSEWALANPAARAYLRPILAENGGWQIFNTTPRGRNHAYRTFHAAKADPRAFAQILAASDTGSMTKERLDLERAAYIADFGQDAGEALFSQEYECSFEAALLGAVLGRSIERARREDRIAEDIGYDPEGSPLVLSSDIGFSDTAAWWFWQPMIGGFHLVDYMQGSGNDADDWVQKIQARAAERGYKLDKIYLPHDARAQSFATKHSAIERFLSGFGAEVCRIVPQSRIADRINAARRIITRCAFAMPECQDGIDALSSWQFIFNEDTRSFSNEPRHDWASHPGDAFSYGAQMLEERLPAEDAPFPPPVVVKPDTVADLLRDHAKMVRNRRRI